MTSNGQTSSSSPPKVETALLWDLLDYAISSSPVVDDGNSSENVELTVNTQFLQPINAETPPHLSAQTQHEELPRLDIWEPTFDFDDFSMTGYANIPDMPEFTTSTEFTGDF